MSYKFICNFNHKEWKENNLKDFGEFAECVEYVNQREYGDGQLEGEWYYIPDEVPPYVIYYGTFGNYNSPGASSYTFAEIYEEDEKEEYQTLCEKWRSCEEYEECETEDEEEDDCEPE